MGGERVKRVAGEKERGRSYRYVRMIVVCGLMVWWKRMKLKPLLNLVYYGDDGPGRRFFFIF